jgi:hypothetical protein
MLPDGAHLPHFGAFLVDCALNFQTGALRRFTYIKKFSAKWAHFASTITKLQILKSSIY